MDLESNVQTTGLGDDEHGIHLFVNWYFWGTILASRWDYSAAHLWAEGRKDPTSSQRTVLKIPCCQSPFASVQGHRCPCSTRIQSLLRGFPGPLILFSPGTRAQALSISVSPPWRIYMSASEGWRRGLFLQTRAQVFCSREVFLTVSVFLLSPRYLHSPSLLPDLIPDKTSGFHPSYRGSPQMGRSQHWDNRSTGHLWFLPSPHSRESCPAAFL